VQKGTKERRVRHDERPFRVAEAEPVHDLGQRQEEKPEVGTR